MNELGHRGHVSGPELCLRVVYALRFRHDDSRASGSSRENSILLFVLQPRNPEPPTPDASVGLGLASP